MDTLGKYAIEAVLGRGSMGVVYRARDRDIDQIVAIKTLRKDVLEDLDDGTLLQRFKNEALAGRRLKHPNIVGIYDYGEYADDYFIVMEYVQGQRLREYFKDDYRFEADEVMAIMTQLLDGLDYAHRHGVVHRDINPSNLLVTDSGTLVIMDFGIAKLDTSTVTRTGMVLGTPAYMSPEQCLGQVVDARSDLFSAGVILYQLVSGERPFAGGTAMSTMQQVLHLSPVLPSLLNVYFPPGIDHVIQKALAKQPDHRFRTAREFTMALKSVRQPTLLPALPAFDAVDPRINLPVAAPIAPCPPPVAKRSRRMMSDFTAAIATGFATVIALWYLVYSVVPLVEALRSALLGSSVPVTATESLNPSSTAQNGAMPSRAWAVFGPVAVVPVVDK